jgi:hypothetical protein
MNSNGSKGVVYMFKFEIVEDVEMNDNSGGWIIVKVRESGSWLSIVVKVVEDEVVEFVELSFDFGESLCGCLIVEKDSNGKWIEKKVGENSSSNIEGVFSEECCDKIRSMEFINE